MSETILVTGGLGFIGSNFVHMLNGMGYPDTKIVVMDKMTYAADKANLGEELMDKIDLYEGDIADLDFVLDAMLTIKPDYVVNFAAESHVDRSIVSSSEFVMSNVVGVQVLLDVCRKVGVKRFLQVSTDEVYGDLGPLQRPSVETDPLKPSSPYSASKAAADLLVLAYARTHGMDVVITRCSNNYGPRQYAEKLIPLAIKRLQQGLPVPVYGNGSQIRDWIHVSDHCKGILAALTKGKAGEIYNFGGDTQVRNIDLIRMLIRLIGVPEEGSIKFVADRSGHDTRYAIDCRNAKFNLAWKPVVSFEWGLEKTVQWYLQSVQM